MENPIGLAAKPGHLHLQPRNPDVQPLQRPQRAHRFSGNHGPEDRLQFRHQRARTDGSLLFRSRRNAHRRGHISGPDLQRLSGPHRQCLHQALRLHHPQGGASGTPQTITLNSSNNTLAGLASAINSSGVGITASVLTDSSGSRLSLVSGTSGANGNIAVTANSIAAAATATLGYTGTAGTPTTYSGGTLAAVANPSDLLTGSIQIAVAGGTPQTITLASGGENLTQVASDINNPATGVPGVTASVVLNSDGSSSLSLVSNTEGSTEP